MWLDQESWPSYTRPDKSGLIASFRGRYEGIPIVVVTELWPKAMDSSVGKEIIEALKNKRAFIVVYGPEDCGVLCHHLGITSEEQVDEIMSFLGAASDAARQEHQQVPFEFI